MKDLIGKKVSRIVELNVEGKSAVFGEVLKETKFKTGNRAVVLKVEGLITNATENSVEIYQNKWTENGVNAYGWFEKGKFEKLFVIE